MSRNRNQASEGESEELLRRVQNGDEAAFGRLCELYRPLLTAMSESADERYRRYGSEAEDLRQEATLALYKASMSYRLDQSEVTFGLYAKICIRNRLISTGRRLIRQHSAKTATMQKEIAARASASRYSIPRTPDLAALSDFECRVYRLYCKGYPYAKIAEMLGKPEKSVDNAIYRLRKKLRQQNI